MTLVYQFLHYTANDTYFGLAMTSNRILAGIALAAALLIGGSCAGRTALRYEKIDKAVGKNDYLAVIDQIRKPPRLYDNNSRFLYYMDIGILFHYAGLYDSSTVFLEQAVTTWDDLYARSVTNEAASILVNDNVRPYRSKPFELTMLHQLIMLNYLAQRNANEALVEARRVQVLFNEWNRKDRNDVKYHSDGLFHYLAAIAYDATAQRSDALISLYHSVDAYNQGAVALPAAVRDYAYYRLRNGNRADDCTALKLTPGAAESAAPSLNADQSEIIVVGYAGRGPALSEASWRGTYVKDGLLVMNTTAADGRTETVTLPAPPLPQAEYDKAAKGQKTASGTTIHLKFAMPALKTFAARTDHFQVTTDQTPLPVPSILMTDYDKLAAQFLDDSKAATLTRTVVRVVLRTIAAQQTKQELQTSSPIANLLVNLGTDALSDLLERADIRNCFLLPKTVHLTRIPVKPGVHNVEVAACDRNGATIKTKRFDSVTLKAGEKVFLFNTSLE
jgi:hypothetical protein